MIGIRSFPFWGGLCSGAFAVSYRVGSSRHSSCLVSAGQPIIDVRAKHQGIS